jgi:hypothetical protein
MKADEIFPTDYYENSIKTRNAGYEIYDSTLGDEHGYICDLGNRLEVNLPSGETVNIWIEEGPQFPEYQLADALKVISDAIYEIDDNILPQLQKATGIDEARSKLYGAYAEIAKILKTQHPDSPLYKQYNLQDA